METKLNIELGRELEADEVENVSGTGTIGAGIQAGIQKQRNYRSCVQAGVDAVVK
jgi:hypothetical protein